MVDDYFDYLSQNENYSKFNVFKDENFTFIAFEDIINLPLEGWKIHVSSRFKNAKFILSVVFKYCINNKINFKFLKNDNILKKWFNKNFSTAQSGKFITIYPKDIESFKLIVKDLNELIGNREAPYILSDKRALNSKCIFYR
ncbi:hypothetical protein [Staphylococcus petrasii]|uniref:class III lanthionine synthetase LanKC N-terminal domain-containing protein n=1 Tax=Staphylococcus petrasii TaxID=1276936 RepID=UPI001F5859A0|nr:hypothetical protein [Staphylococcus petrasii]MCI2774502.1 hypothetical protein [Staphylococcus petrasii]